MSKANVRSFQAVEAFRVALASYAESAAAALESAEAEGQRWLRWLEHDQRAHWKAMRRQATEELARAKDAFRQKTLYKDSSGARHAGVDEQREVRRCEARLEEAEQREAATKRHAIQLKNELQTYRGGAAKLRNLLGGAVPVAVADLREAVASLERYAAVRPDLPAREDTGASVSREPLPALEPGDLADDSELRLRTPGPRSRARAAAGSNVPLLPDVPAAAREATAERLSEQAPARYDLITLSLPPVTEPDEWHLYLERVEPTATGDSGWHVGWAGIEDARGVPTTVTFGRLAAAAPFVADLLRLPTGSLVVARGNTVVRLIDGLGRCVWQGDEEGTSP